MLCFRILQNVPTDPLQTILTGQLPSVDAVLQGNSFFAGVTLNEDFDILLYTSDSVETVEIRNLRPAKTYDAYFVIQAQQVVILLKLHTLTE